jgi:hypothetical protein
VHEMVIDKDGKRRFLNLRVWDDDTNFIHTCWTLAELTNAEADACGLRQGGRLRRYREGITSNLVDIRIDSKRETLVLSQFLDWIGEHVEGGWSVDFDPDEPTSLGGPMGLGCVAFTLKLYFENIEEAVLCKLSLT